MGSMVYQVERALKEQLRTGESRHAAKIREGTRAPEGIFSFSSLETYLKQGCTFAKWAHTEHGCNTLAKARPFVEVYLQNGIDRGLSANTLCTQRAALCKLYKCHAEDLNITLPVRHRADITRSRGNAARDYGFSQKNNADIIAFAKATGLRVHELRKVTPAQIQKIDDKLKLVRIEGKGGKIRDVEVLPGRYDDVAKFMRTQGDPNFKTCIFPKIPSHMDTHGYRREYTAAFYKQIARSLKSLDKKQKYFCRNDKRGVVYDKAAMLYVSRQLGHNRISVIAGHYL